MGKSRFLKQRAVKVGEGSQQEVVVDDNKSIPATQYNGKYYDPSGNVIDPKRIGKPILDSKGAKIAIAKTDESGKEYSVWGFEGRDGKILTAKDEDGKEVRVPSTRTEAQQQRSQVFQSMQRLEQESTQLRNRLLNLDKEVSQDPAFIDPAKRGPEIERRRAQINGVLGGVEKNLEANQKILLQYGGPGSLYDTGGASTPPPGTVQDIVDWANK